MAYLILVGGPKVNTVHRINDGSCKVGRGMPSPKHVSIEKDEYVSRRGRPDVGSVTSVGEVGHAEFTKTESGWYVRDIISENGVFFVDGGNVFRLVEGGSKKLRPATLLECGQTPVLFMEVDEPPSDDFVKAASQSPRVPGSSGSMGHSAMDRAKSTSPLETPGSEVPELLLRWSTIVAALKGHGYEKLLH